MRPFGLIAAAVTPMEADGAIAFQRIPELVERLRADGVSGLYVLGSTGEGPSLSSRERMRVAEVFAEAAAGNLRVIVQVGHNSLAEARDLAAHAASIGVDGISATPPSFFRPRSLDDLVSCAAEVACAAPDLPFYYYHIPSATGVELPMPAFVAAARDRITNFRGLKFSDPRQFALQACLEVAGDELEVFNGVDEMLLGAVAVGAREAVGATYNFAGPLYLRMIERWEAGDLEGARHLQGRSAAMIEIILRICGLSGWKAVMPLVDMDCGPCRLPLPTPGSAERLQLKSELERIGFFEWAR